MPEASLAPHLTLLSHPLGQVNLTLSSRRLILNFSSALLSKIPKVVDFAVHGTKVCQVLIFSLCACIASPTDLQGPPVSVSPWHTCCDYLGLSFIWLMVKRSISCLCPRWNGKMWFVGSNLPFFSNKVISSTFSTITCLRGFRCVAGWCSPNDS